MTEGRIAIDTVAAVDFFHAERPTPEAIEQAESLILPLPVVGELHFGAMNAPPVWRPLMLEKLESLIELAAVISPDLQTVPFYATVRSAVKFPPNISRRRESHLLNDLWIAALCLQHNLPLLTNDTDFDLIEDLRLIHW